MNELWEQWLADWRQMAATAERRGWAVSGPTLGPPAGHAQIAETEARCGIALPAQLKAVLSGLAQRVEFSWSIPRHLQAHGRFDGLSNGGMRDVIWDIAQLEPALDNFNSWRADLGSPDAREGEAGNAPEMWENQFPFAVAINGDMLTIDVRHAEGDRQPVRYFSHELEGLHGHALAPSFDDFITVYSKLGCVGNSHDEWFGFVPEHEPGRDARESYLSVDTPGARAWLAWLAADPKVKSDDEPPTPVPARSHADRALLTAAKSNDLTGVERALAAGADPDCYNDDDGGFREFSTAISDAVAYDTIAMLDLLLSHGAVLDTRRLPLTVAAQYSAPATVDALIARGARANGWRGDRYTPLHSLITQRETFLEMRATGQANKIGEVTISTDFSAFEALDPTAPDFAEKVTQLTDKMFNRGPDNRTETDLAGERRDFLAILDALLAAGADSNAPWDNRSTMLMWADEDTMSRLLAHGADPNQRNYAGCSALHFLARPSAAKARMLLAHGAEIDALTNPDKSDGSRAAPHTPLQANLRRQDGAEVADVLLAAGADPLIRDGEGRSTLFYCRSREAMERMMALGLKVTERAANGDTLIHARLIYSGGALAEDARQTDLLKFLVESGVDIDAQDAQGRTALHLLAAQSSEYRHLVEDAQVLLDLGARRDIRDKDGKWPADVAHKKAKDLRGLLK